MFLVFFCWALFLTAQMTDKGNFSVGSTVGFSSASSTISKNVSGVETKGDGPSSVQYSFAPTFSYFILPNWSVGIGMSYTNSNVEQADGDQTADSDLLFGPVSRYYLPLGRDMALFAQADFGFGNTNDLVEEDGMRESIETSIFAVGFGPGFTIFSERAVGIEALLKYNYAQSNFDTEIGGVKATTITNTNQFDFSIGVQIYFTRLQPALRD